MLSESSDDSVCLWEPAQTGLVLVIEQPPTGRVLAPLARAAGGGRHELEALASRRQPAAVKAGGRDGSCLGAGAGQRPSTPVFAGKVFFY